MSEFLHMGGYAAYVWSAYALAAVVLVWNIRSAVVAHREAKLRAAIAARWAGTGSSSTALKPARRALFCSVQARTFSASVGRSASQASTTTSVSLTQGLGRIGRKPMLCLREASLGRHFEILVPMPDALDEQAVVGFAGHDRGAGDATLGPAVTRVEAQAALQFFRVVAVAFVALLDEHGPDAALEKGNAINARGACGRWASRSARAGELPW